MPYKLILFIFFSYSIAAQENIDTFTISQDSTWLKLLHYKKKTLIGSYSSDISSDDFFLSEDGKKNPQGELEATIKAFSEGLPSNPNQHAQCRFPARYIWLKKKLPHLNQLSSVKCPAYNEWTHYSKISAIDLVFATGYLGNPASYFGHPLLKIHYSDNDSTTNLLDTAINYGAFTPPRENSILFAFKGLFGFYNAGLTYAPYYFSRSIYSELELRDLWQYELRLDQAQIEFLSAHIWEVWQKKFPYYFLKDNCAYRISEILSLVLLKPLVPQNVPYTIPYSIINNLVENDFVNKITLSPSRENRFKNKYLNLSKTEKSIAVAIVKDFNSINDFDYINLSQDEKIHVLNFLIDYYEFSLIKDFSADLKNKKDEIILKRIQLPAEKTKEHQELSEPPHMGQKTVLTHMGFQSKNSEINPYIHLRPAYYDLLTPNIGRMPNSKLVVFDTEIMKYHNKPKINFFDLISVETLNNSKTGLANDGGLAWKFNLGLDDKEKNCDRCLVGKIESGIGYATQFASNNLIYINATARFQTSSYQSDRFKITPALFYILEIPKIVKTIIHFGKEFSLLNIKDRINNFGIENRFVEHKEWDIRFSYEYRLHSQTKIGLSYYW